MGMRLYKATLGREDHNDAKVFTVEANNRNNAYWVALGHAISGGMWPRCLFMLARVVEDG